MSKAKVKSLGEYRVRLRNEKGTLVDVPLSALLAIGFLSGLPADPLTGTLRLQIVDTNRDQRGMQMVLIDQAVEYVLNEDDD